MKYLLDIISFLGNEMSPEESLDFEERLKIDKALRKEYNVVSKAWKIIKENLRMIPIEAYKDRQELITDILASIDIEEFAEDTDDQETRTFRKALEESAPKKRGPELATRLKTWPFLLSAAVIAGMIIVFVNLYNTKHLFDHYYQPTKDPCLSVLSRDLSEDSRIRYLFLAGREEQAREILDSLEAGCGLTASDSLVSALLYLESGELEHAKLILMQLKNKSKSGYQNAASWYLALLAVKSGELKQAEFILQELEQGAAAYRENAASLLKKVQSGKKK